MKKKEFACVPSTKLDFSVGSFDFRLQVEADHHGATKHTQQTTRAKTAAHTAHTAGTQRSHSGQHTDNGRSGRQRSHRGQHTDNGRSGQ